MGEKDLAAGRLRVVCLAGLGYFRCRKSLRHDALLAPDLRTAPPPAIQKGRDTGAGPGLSSHAGVPMHSVLITDGAGIIGQNLVHAMTG